MYIKKITYLSVLLLIVLAIGVSSVTAQPIQPSGENVGSDEQGNVIYQVQANGIKIGYKLIGSGEPLVMIMGLGGTMEDWPQEVIEALSKKYQLIILDNRGMGYTTANDVTFTNELFVADVIGLLDALEVKKANVLGFSMGSTITQVLLLEYSQRLNKVIVYAPSTDGSDVVKTIAGAVIDDPIILRQIEATALWRTPLDKMSSVTNDVMFIVGTSDTTVGIESSKTLASTVPGAWLVQFKNATHVLMRETPAEFAKIVLTFLGINMTVEVQ